MVLVDWQIEELAGQGMLSPFQKELIRTCEEGKNIPSYGLSAHGYDVRLAPEWKVARQVFDEHNKETVFDLKEEGKEVFFEHVEAESIIIPAGGFVLARTIETFKMPTNVMGTAFCKSTLARSGLTLPPTVIECGWEGELVLEIFNHAPYPIRYYADMGAAQVLFFQLSDVPDTPYDESRKYQGQTGITLPR